MFTESVNGIYLSFETTSNVFSPSCIDDGTLAMLSTVTFEQDDKVLDLGCGYGVVGILAAKLIDEQSVTMSDIDAECINLSKKNAQINDVGGVNIIQSDGFRNIQEKDFTLILSNPPYHTDFSVAKRFIEKGFNRLRLGGKMVMVTKRKDWYKNKLTAIFGGVKVSEINNYYVFCAEKRNTQYASVIRRY